MAALPESVTVEVNIDVTNAVRVLEQLRIAMDDLSDLFGEGAEQMRELIKNLDDLSTETFTEAA